MIDDILLEIERFQTDANYRTPANKESIIKQLRKLEKKSFDKGRQEYKDARWVRLQVMWRNFLSLVHALLFLGLVAGFIVGGIYGLVQLANRVEVKTICEPEPASMAGIVASCNERCEKSDEYSCQDGCFEALIGQSCDPYLAIRQSANGNYHWLPCSQAQETDHIEACIDAGWSEQ